MRALDLLLVLVFPGSDATGLGTFAHAGPRQVQSPQEEESIRQNAPSGLRKPLAGAWLAASLRIPVRMSEEQERTPSRSDELDP
jgi:hypothetical protein